MGGRGRGVPQTGQVAVGGRWGEEGGVVEESVWIYVNISTDPVSMVGTRW